MTRRRGLVIRDKQMWLVDDILSKLREVSGSRFIALVSTSGQPITTSSAEEYPDTLSPASLAASSFAAFGRETQVGKVRLYTGRAIEVLKPIFASAEDDSEGEMAIDTDYSHLADEAIDSLFADLE